MHGAHVADETAGVEVEARAAANEPGEGSGGVDGAEVDGEVLQGAGGDAAAAVLRWFGDGDVGARDGVGEGAVGDFGAVAGEGGV